MIWTLCIGPKGKIYSKTSVTFFPAFNKGDVIFYDNKDGVKRVGLVLIVSHDMVDHRTTVTTDQDRIVG